MKHAAGPAHAPCAHHDRAPSIRASSLLISAILSRLTAKQAQALSPATVPARQPILQRSRKCFRQHLDRARPCRDCKTAKSRSSAPPHIGLHGGLNSSARICHASERRSPDRMPRATRQVRDVAQPTPRLKHSPAGRARRAIVHQDCRSSANFSSGLIAIRRFAFEATAQIGFQIAVRIPRRPHFGVRALGTIVSSRRKRYRRQTEAGR